MYDFDSMSQTPQEPEYTVDLIICIDGTGSMWRMIDTVKEEAKDLYAYYANAMRESDRKIKEDGFRVKVIVFRDFADDNSPALEPSPFYMVPRDSEAFNSFVDRIEPKGGGDAPESALEAIVTAMKAAWEPKGGRYRRQAIVVFTDTCTYNLKNPDRVKNPNYPSGMPNDFEELRLVWENGDQEICPYYSPRNGRLIIFAPLNTGLSSDEKNSIIEWESLSSWKRTWVTNVRADGGCDEVDLEQAMAALVGSFGGI